MSIDVAYWVTCDRCGTDTGDNLETAELATRFAVEEGWHLTDDEDLCPDCGGSPLPDPESGRAIR
jgi:hypothetical protein